MSDAVEQIKNKLSIIDVVTPYVELHKAGKNLKGKSPFTSEKTPSFFVSPDRGMYYCFSTSKGGDIFTFTQEMEGVDFKGALTILAEKADVELVAEDPKKRSQRDQLYAMMEVATLFFEAKLKAMPAALAYLQERGVSPETIAHWRIGFAPGPPAAGWRELGAELETKGYTAAAGINAGLLKTSEPGKAPYDVFRDRIVFPIKDPQGRVIAFSGRILSTDSQAPKYVNSPDTDLFHKSEALYGYDKAKEGIRKFDFSLIVEGQFDVVLAHQAGYSNTVAVSGTSLTANHVALLQRLSNRVVLALDADKAGIAAIKRAADVMLVRGMDVKVAVLPAGKDPADLVQADPKTFKSLIGSSVHVIEFLLSVLKADAKDERTYKLRARDEVVPYVLKVQNYIDRDHFETVIATALNTTKDAIHLETERLQEASVRPTQKMTAPSILNTSQAPTEVTSRQKSLSEYIVVCHSLLSPALQDNTKRAFETMTGQSLELLLSAVTPERLSKLTFTLEAEFAELDEEEQKELINEKLHELALLSIRERVTETKQSLYEAERTGDDTDALLQTVNELQKALGEASAPRDYLTETNPSASA